MAIFNLFPALVKNKACSADKWLVWNIWLLTDCNTSEVTLPCSGSIASFTQWGQHWSLISNCLLTHVPWISGHCAGFLLLGGGRGSSIRKVEVSFKSGKPHSTFRPQQGGTLVWVLVSHGQSQTSVGLSDIYYFRVCTKLRFHDTKLMEWVNHLGLPLIPIRQSSQVRKVPQLASWTHWGRSTSLLTRGMFSVYQTQPWITCTVMDLQWTDYMNWFM